MFKKYRILRGYTQEKLAELTQVDIRTIQRIENNDTVPTIETIRKLITVLKIDDNDILQYLKNVPQEKEKKPIYN